MRKKLLIFAGIGLIILICGLVFALLRYQNTSAERPENKYTGRVRPLHSAVDMDGDGIDDQTDILESALRYVKTEPKYKSRYYATGYPDDGYGVCTDLVAIALKDAGYDLMELVQKDIAENPESYNIDTPDGNIDFRRVNNLKVYFSHTAITLTTDVSDFEAWQGGDIIIFESHIGIVSDRRNKSGTPYIIHHNDPWQTAYEQDILESRNDIVGHYRISQ